MYRLVNLTNGHDIGMTENPRYIKKAKNGCLDHTEDVSEATGVAYMGIPFNLPNTEGVGAECDALVIKCDGGENMTLTEATLAAHSQTLDDLLVMALTGGVNNEV